MIKWDASKEDVRTIQKIAYRAGGMLVKLGESFSTMDLQMDITAAHCNGNPLDLDKLLAFDDFNFAHDVFGIIDHIDRTTGKLKHCFLPRCTSH